MNTHYPKLEKFLIPIAVRLPLHRFDIVVGPLIGSDVMGWSYQARRHRHEGTDTRGNGPRYPVVQELLTSLLI